MAKISLEDLASIEVTSVSRKVEELGSTSAAVYVITQEDIRRSGLTSVPELLRSVPGLDVAQINSSMWAISSRGFNERVAKMMLVLIDGRSVYSSLFSGVLWDVQDLPLIDIERIEVIRGPGATMWGANAVNGIVNIITKNAKDTVGNTINAVLGAEERPLVDVRHGGKIGDGFFRVYARGFERNNFLDASGDAASDAWRQKRVGFRVDWNGVNSCTVQGDIYDGVEEDVYTYPVLTPPYSETRAGTTTVSGGHLLGRWSRSTSDDSDMYARVYFDRTSRDSTQIGDQRSVYDIDFNHRFAAGKRQSIIWGLGYRYTRDAVSSRNWMLVDPARDSYRVASAFIQDDIVLRKDRSRITLGSKFESNSYTGLEIQPNIRFLYTPEERQTLWAAISRAVRTPSRAENDALVQLQAFPMPDGTPVLVSIRGNRDLESEKLTAYEIGWRSEIGRKATVDLAAFYNSYDGLRTTVANAPALVLTPIPHLEIAMDLVNGGRSHAYGAEVIFNWTPSPAWRLAGSYTWLSHGSDVPDIVGADPRNQFSIKSRLDLPRGFEMDTDLYWVDQLNLAMGRMGIPASASNIPSYLRLDMRLGWRANESVTISVGGRNMLDDRHLEFPGLTGERATEVPRSFYGQVAWRF